MPTPNQKARSNARLRLLAHATAAYEDLRARWPTGARELLAAALRLAGRSDRPPLAYADELAPHLEMGLTQARLVMGERLADMATAAADVPELRGVAREYLQGAAVEGSPLAVEVRSHYRRWLVAGPDAVD